MTLTMLGPQPTSTTIGLSPMKSPINVGNILDRNSLHSILTFKKQYTNISQSTIINQVYLRAPSVQVGRCIMLVNFRVQAFQFIRICHYPHFLSCARGCDTFFSNCFGESETWQLSHLSTFFLALFKGHEKITGRGKGGL